MAGKKYYAWLSESDFVNGFWSWYNNDEDTTHEFKQSIGFEGNKKSSWKMVLKAVMKERGRTAKEINPLVGGKQSKIIAYDRTAWKE